jgi:LacI family transcriptional regulator, galactose operon repressor
MREVAEKAGVAMSSVSRVMSGHPDVSPAMRTRVLAAVEELGYEPDLLAQSLRRRETLTIGFVVGDISNPVLAETVKGAEGRLREEGYSVLLSNSEGDARLDAEYVRVFSQRRVDGLMLSLASETEPATLEALYEIETPCVLLDREVDGLQGASVVLADHRAGMRAAVGHLLDLGHRRIGLIAGPEMRPTRERTAGAHEAYAQRGIEDELAVVPGTFNAEHGEQASDALLSGPEPPTALVAGGNQLLIGVLRTLLRRDLRFPTDVSLLTCDDTEITTVLRPPIGAVSRNSLEAGRAAADLLLRRLRSPDSGPETVMLETQFTARQSCAPPR